VTVAFRSDDAALVRRNRWWLALGASPYAVGLSLILTALVTGVWPVAVPAFHMGIFGTLGLLWAYRANKSPVKLGGGISIGDAGVYHAGKLLAGRDELEAGFITPRPTGVTVRLQRRGRRASLTIAVKDVEEGRALLRALGLDATQTAAELRAASDMFAWSLSKQLVVMTTPIFAAVFTIMGLAVVLGASKALAVIVPLMLVTVFTGVFGLIFTPTRVRIGVDGIATRWLGKDRFIPFSKMRGVQAYEERVGGKTYLGIALDLDDGERVKVPAGQKGFTSMEPAELEERIREALTVHRDGAGLVDERLLARGRRAVPEWIAALRALGAGANADLRTPPVPPEKLLRIAEDAAAAPLVRVGAAVAAAASAPDAKRRVRLAAQTTASPKLRVALERVSADDATDESVAEALADLDAAEARTARASS
jgi:hypothetical protein